MTAIVVVSLLLVVMATSGRGDSVTWVNCERRCDKLYAVACPRDCEKQYGYSTENTTDCIIDCIISKERCIQLC
ncbi:hypothetical protein LSAT2_018739 [Lamellibrachia satsuma]|nr:hypothetical protein LSAT2_018739 [Lamellibrachia satsuma]